MASGSNLRANNTPPNTATPPNTVGQTHLRWTDDMDVVLTSVLIDEVRLRGRKPNNGGLKPASLRSAAEKVTFQTGVPVTTTHVRNRLKPMKKQYYIARAAINSSGFGIQWDGVNKYLDVEESAWDEYCKDKSREVRNLRRKFFPLYDALWEIFGDEGACGEGVFNHLDPQFSDSPRGAFDNTGESLDDDEDPVDIGQETPPPLPTNASNGQRKRRQDPLAAAVLQNGLNIGRVADAIADLAAGRVPFDNLWSALLKIEGVDMDLKIKASQVFAKDAGLLSVFLSTPDEYKEQALRILLQSHNLV